MSHRRNPAHYKWWCYDCEEFVPENEVCLSVHTGPNGCQGDCTPAIEARPTAKDIRIRDLEAQLARVRELPGKWRSDWKDNRQHDAYSCADELEATLQSAAEAGSNQPEVDDPKSAG